MVIERILVQGVLTYLALIALLRLTGNRTLTKLNAFDLIVTVALGSLLGTSILGDQARLPEGVAALALLVFLQYALSWLAVRSGRLNHLIKTPPTLLVVHGHLRRETLLAARITEDEVHAAVREAGLGDLAAVAAVVLEADGQLSVIPEERFGGGTVVMGIGRAPGGPRPRRYRALGARAPIPWRAGAAGGVAGAALMLLGMGAWFGYFGAGFWVPFYALAASLSFLPDFALAAAAVGTVLHLAIGAAWGLGYAALLGAIAPPVRGRLAPALLGAAYGLGAYVLVGLTLGPGLLQATRTLEPNAYMAAHLVLGVTIALAVSAQRPRPRVTITFSPRQAPSEDQLKEAAASARQP